ncbi:MAG: nitrilase-related carbon-nitrogen hydrolase [Bacillota bacterium]
MPIRKGLCIITRKVTLGEKAREFNTFIIAQATARHPEFAGKAFNCVFIIDPCGRIVHRHYKPQSFKDGHSAVPADVWSRWLELYGYNLDACYPVAETEIGCIGTLSCMEGSPEAARGLVMNGAEIIYKPGFLQPYVAGDLWQAVNRIRALDNSCYFISPKEDANNLLQKAISFKDTSRQSLSEPNYGPDFVYVGAIIDIAALREFRSRTSGKTGSKTFAALSTGPPTRKRRSFASLQMHWKNQEPEVRNWYKGGKLSFTCCGWLGFISA